MTDSSQTLPDSVVLNTKNYKILTPNGYEDFLGINKITKDSYIHLKFSNGRSLKCSEDHPLSTIDGIVRAKDIDKKTCIDSNDGGCFVISKRRIKRKIVLYDIINSGRDHLYYTNGIVSHNCKFLGGSDTLISGDKLANMTSINPIRSSNDLDIYEEPKATSTYFMTVDVADGVKQNYSAFVIFCIDEIPYRVVAKYRSNSISQERFSTIIHPIASEYNNAYVLIEINKGITVATNLYDDLGYENILMCMRQGRIGQVMGQGIGIKSNLGFRMDISSKKQGCMSLKTLVEMDKLIINDYDIIQELCSFIEKVVGRFEAESGKTDDLVVCLHRTTKIQTEDGVKTIKWVVDNKYTGKVLSMDSSGNLVWSRVINHSAIENRTKKWIGIRGNSKNTLMCTPDHKIAYIDDIFNPKIHYTEAENMMGRYNVCLVGQRFHKTNPLYNKDQLSAIVGSLMGDSSITKVGRLVTAHSVLQKDYAMHKHEIFKGALSECPARGASKISYRVDALTNGQTHKLRELFYPNGTKIVKNVLHMLDEISLAYWYMDDGYLHSNSVFLCTDSFSYEEHILIQEFLLEKFNIVCKISKLIRKKTQEEYYRIYIGMESRDVFFGLIAPYVIDSMSYKLPEKFKNIEKKSLNTKCLDFGSELITKIYDAHIVGNESKLYDITVEDTHNFIASNMLVHNCLIIFAWAITTQYFKEISETDLFKNLKEEYKHLTEEEFAFLGFYSNPVLEMIQVEQDEDGDVWMYDSDIQNFDGFQEQLGSYFDFMST